jgi:hypothetical protein
MFARFAPSVLTGSWHDANGDGIPYEYRFPGGSLDGDLPDLPDARGLSEIPGGPPLYRRYLTAAEIGPVGNTGASLRYHPALAGYRGYLVHELWMDVPESSIAGAEAAVLGRPPNEIRLITSSEAPWFSEEGAGVMGDHYFERTRGYVVPDVTGDYVFSIAGDDDCELWFATRGTRAGATRIASVSGWTGFRDFTKSAAQSSAPMQLTAGRSYYVEILHRDGGGDDHCSVSWITPGSPDRVLIPSANLRCLPAELIDATGE